MVMMNTDITFTRSPDDKLWLGSDGITNVPLISGGDGSTEFTQGVVESDPNAVANGFVLDAGGGVLTGVEPGARPAPLIRTPEFVQGAQIDPNATQVVGTPIPGNGVQMFTAEDVERIRKEEKDKLYHDLDETKKSLKAMEKRDKERADAETAAQAAAAEEARKKAEDEMELRELLTTKESQWQTQLQEERAARERLEATLDMERQFVSLTQYRSQRLDAERENILPELIDLVTGNSEEEIETSIASLRERTASILGNVQAAAMQTRQSLKGTQVTAPPVGPLETQSTQQTLTPDDIRNMDINTYAQNRDRLLGATRQMTKERGIYG